jgi:hypothetical protein
METGYRLLSIGIIRSRLTKLLRTTCTGYARRGTPVNIAAILARTIGMPHSILLQHESSEEGRKRAVGIKR